MTEEIQTASTQRPLIARYEPGFKRAFAQGSLIRTAPDDPDHARLSFWSSLTKDIQVDDGITGTGYNMECEVVMTWAALDRLKKLIELWQTRRVELEAGTMEPMSAASAAPSGKATP